jgi:anthranilate phosphoribosyltransferase
MIRTLNAIVNGQVLSESEAQAAMSLILSGQATPEQIGAFLTAFHFRPPSGAELTGFAKILRAQAHKVSLDSTIADSAVDVCGTGGDGLGSFNVSTCVAFVVAASGHPIAKHGNRAVSSKCGSFDVLEKLGVPFAEDASSTNAMLNRFSLAFLYAPSFHPVLKSLALLRRSLGFRTVFNALGPLLNPTGVKRQLIGVYSDLLILPVAETLRTLGAKRAMVVHGEDGTDEISTSAPTRIAYLNDEKIELIHVRPEDFQITSVPNAAIVGGDATRNAELFRQALSRQPSAYRDIVLINAAAALVVSGKTDHLQDGFALARETVECGKALDLLNSMIQNAKAEVKA